MTESKRLELRPLAEQVVVHAGQLHESGVMGRFGANPLNRGVEVEEQRPLPVVSNHALNPEERADAYAARYRAHVMKTRRRIEHQMPGRQLHAMHAAAVL